MILTVGATGLLGGKVCRNLRRTGHRVRALVRQTADQARLRALEAEGIELSFGDLKSESSLDAALRGVRTVITTATATVSRSQDDSIETVDLRGQLHLLDAAKRAAAEHFIYASFYPQPIDFPLQTAKRTVERAIAASDIAYTIVQPTDFMEVWLSAALGFDPVHGNVRILGDGSRTVSWCSVEDVAALIAKSVDTPTARNRTLPLGGAPLSYLDVLKIFEGLGVSVKNVEAVPEAAIAVDFDKAPDPLSRSISALMLNTARGQVAPSAEACAVLGTKLKTVADYAAEIIAER